MKGESKICFLSRPLYQCLSGKPPLGKKSMGKLLPSPLPTLPYTGAYIDRVRMEDRCKWETSAIL